ncbi:MAG: TPM domain-containing protein [Clostridiales bacterium]|nr:TPM domain-containing protein [Clostridiales bacterium]
MKKLRWITGMILCIYLLMPAAVWAAEGKTVVDQADLLTDQEEQLLEEKASRLSEEWNQDFVLVTTANAEGKTSEEYADDYYDYNGYGENGVLYLIDMDNCNVQLSTSGAMIRFLPDYRIELVIDAGYEQLQAGNYGDCLMNMLEETEAYMEQGIPDDQYTYDVETGKISRYRSITTVELLIALAVAAAVGIIFAVSVTASYKMKHGSYSYPFQNKGRMDLTHRDDDFINEVVTRRKIPKDTSSGGGGGSGKSSVHTSSSGRSHGGGGRGF